MGSGIVGIDKSRAHEDGALIKKHVLQRQNLYYQRAFPSSSAPRDTTGTDFDFWRIACPDLQWMTLRHGDKAIVALSRAFEHIRLEQTELARQDAMQTISNSLRDFDFFVTDMGNAGSVHRGLADIGDSILILAGAPSPFCARRVPTSSQKQFALKSVCLVDSQRSLTWSATEKHHGAITYTPAAVSSSIELRLICVEAIRELIQNLPYLVAIPEPA
ncbi:uncharacterized protein MYCGRDRAFT_96575 [Zymoseptoria tritici IPO323]|uniref:Uncharacterized protein n=1 Tax=Zymoseptoria tritici (strain CBS 115943 / IPO323) TaxID=336722 RepID=F9XMU5_ZYMTI|nr:uncharacterized protein MYCGRDRAFT_96575 [Zymoseptoria tritici IPO323]EGP83302.1 hypothetical protein MYCGRDRAFT_96575 [Zymoseptoria tritici IPO323]